MSFRAAREVARNISDAFDFLRRPGHEYGREFLLNTGTDAPGDFALLSNPVVLSNSSNGEVSTEYLLPAADGNSLESSAGRLQVVYTLIPIVTGNLTCGLSVQLIDSPFVTNGRKFCSVGRFVRCEATGEMLFRICHCALK